ncbi:unnamed protein product [Coregonus sp. 'balchen']|nr:unnamed protein product [Coregonus sp. 'balchen']
MVVSCRVESVSVLMSGLERPVQRVRPHNYSIHNPRSHIQTPLHNSTLLYLTLDLTFRLNNYTTIPNPGSHIHSTHYFTTPNPGSHVHSPQHYSLDLTFRIYISWNFCNSSINYEFSFPRTTVGWSAYSEQLCGKDTTSAGLPEASARCLNDTGSPTFGPPHNLQCELTLSGIKEVISSSSGDLAQLAFSTQILTSQPELLSADNITTAAQIANTLLQSVNITEDIAVAAVTTISQLLNARKESAKERDAVQSLTETLEEFSLDQHSNVSLVVQPNLVVQSVQVPSDTVGIQFTALTGRSGNFVANRIHLNTNTSELIADNGGSTDVQIAIKFSPDLRNKNTNYSIGFVLYQNDWFFRSRAFTASSGTSRRVISANLGQVSGLHVEMLFKPTASLYDFACVWWNYTLKDWSTSGCSKVNHSEDGLRCFCNHTTNFAVLMSFRMDFKYAEVLNWITILGCSMSIIGLSLTITFQIATRGPCTAVTVLLQYFLLGTFTWNTLYATHVFLMIRNSLATSPSHFTACTVAIGWGLPAVVVALTLGISYRVDDPLGYRQEEFCWLAALDPKGNFDFNLPMFWGFLIPVAITAVYDRSLSMLVIFPSTRHTLMKKKFLSSFSLAVGLQVFILFTARTAIVKKNMSSALKSVSSAGIPLHTKKFSLWRGEQSEKVESYTQQDTDLDLTTSSAVPTINEKLEPATAAPTSTPITSTTLPTTSTPTPPTTSPTTTSPTTSSPTTTSPTTTSPTTTSPTTSPTTTTTTSPTTTSPTTTPPLVCINGGELESGDDECCICPDEWIGETCSEVHTTTLLYLTLDLTFTVQTTTLLLTLDLTFRVHNTSPWISHSEWIFHV